MPLVRATADMISFMDWEGYVPDDVPEDERWRWIKDNVGDIMRLSAMESRRLARNWRQRWVWM